MELASGLQIAAVDRPGTDDLVLLFRRVIYESYGMARTRNPTFFGVLAMVIRTRSTHWGCSFGFHRICPITEPGPGRKVRQRRLRDLRPATGVQGAAHGCVLALAAWAGFR